MLLSPVPRGCDEADLLHILLMGAASFLDKDMSMDVLVDALRAAGFACRAMPE